MKESPETAIQRHLSKISPSKAQVFSTAELLKLLGSKQKIARARKLNKICSLGSGYYSTPALSPFEARLLVVARYYPKAVVAGPSALRVHGLSSAGDEEIEVDIRRTTNQKNRLIHFRRVADRRLCGVTTAKIQGVAIPIYDLERSLIDAILSGLSAEQVEGIWRNAFSKFSVRTGKLRQYATLLGLDIKPHLELARDSVSAAIAPARSSHRDRLIESAFHVFSERGSYGLTLEDVAEHAGVRFETVVSEFETKKKLLQILHETFEHHFRLSFSPDLFSTDRPPREFARDLMKTAIQMIESDPLHFAFQKWSIAEDNAWSKLIIEVIVSAIIHNLKAKIIEAVLGISEDEALSRATLFGSMTHNYTVHYWYYSKHVKVEVSRTVFLESMKRGILENMLDLAFGPPKWNR